MNKNIVAPPENFLEHRVGEHLELWNREALTNVFNVEEIDIPIGKMLRTKLAWCLMPKKRRTDEKFIEDISYICSAIELSHVASLFHDDVIDNGLIRRGMPSLWKKLGKGSSILTGDIFLCEAVSMVLKSGYPELLPDFINKIKETCKTEIEHEMHSNSSKQLKTHDYIKIARGKTGPLFSFSAVAGAYDSHDNDKNRKNEEIGYLIGTAYQLVDDYIDVWGSEKLSGKTLGTDSERDKSTYPQITIDDPDATIREVDYLVKTALDLIEDEHCHEEVSKFLSEKILFNLNNILKTKMTSTC